MTAPVDQLRKAQSLLEHAIGETPERLEDSSLQGLQHVAGTLAEVVELCTAALIAATYECGRQEGVIDGAFMMVPGGSDRG